MTNKLPYSPNTVNNPTDKHAYLHACRTNQRNLTPGNDKARLPGFARNRGNWARGCPKVVVPSRLETTNVQAYCYCQNSKVSQSMRNVQSSLIKNNYADTDYYNAIFR